MALTPLEVMPITAGVTLVVSLVVQLTVVSVQRRFRVRDVLEDDERARSLGEHKLLIERDAAAKLELLRLFAEAQEDLTTLDRLYSRRLSEWHASRGQLTAAVTKRRAVEMTSASRRDADVQAKGVPLLVQVRDAEVRRQLSLCADIVSNWSEFDTFHGDDASDQVMVANDCAGFATRVIGASLRDEVLPAAISQLNCRTPVDGSTRALRKRIPFDWDAAFRKMAAEGHQGAIDALARRD